MPVLLVTEYHFDVTAYVDLITFANCSIGDCFGHDRGILLNILSSIIFSVTKFTACVCRFYDE